MRLVNIIVIGVLGFLCDRALLSIRAALIPWASSEKTQ